MSDEIHILTKADPYVREFGFAGVRLEDALAHLARAAKDVPADGELARGAGIAIANIETARLWILDALEQYERSLPCLRLSSTANEERVVPPSGNTRLAAIDRGSLERRP